MTTVADDGGEAGVKVGVESGGAAGGAAGVATSVAAGGESGSDDNGTTSDDVKYIVNNTDEEEIDFPNTAKVPATPNALKSNRLSRSILTPQQYDELLSNFDGTLAEKIPIYQQWAQETLKNTMLGDGSMEIIIEHASSELQKNLEYDNVEAVLQFWLEATKHPRFYNADYVPSTTMLLVRFPAVLFKQNHNNRKSLTEAIVRLLDITSNHVHFYVKRAIMNEMQTTEIVYIMREVLPIVLLGKLDLTRHGTITQIKSVLLNAEKLGVIRLLEALDLYGKNFDEDVKKAILAASSSQQTPQNEIFSDESSSSAPREQSSDDDDDDSGTQSPDQSPHGQPLTPPQQRFPPNSQGKSAKTQANRLSQKSASAPGAHVVEHHNDTPPPPSPSMEASPSTGIPELLRNEPILCGPQYQPRKRRHPTNFASNKKPQNKNSRVSSRMPRAAASVPHARPVASHQRLAGQPHISEILALVKDRPFFFYGPISLNFYYCGHGDSGISEANSSASTVDNEELADREISADDGHEDAGHDDVHHDDSGHESVDIKFFDDEYDSNEYDSDEYGSDEVDGDGFRSIKYFKHR
ncbi:hypothetical protein DIURU_004630 [Diutina rugosa]|uniref:Uncharacterized protein n=1 Tax=Diutina rugosa TaxID=5481 RepID=A0A642UGQ4_DIURU|nr:uncharacterized protein DIURU_004630 [Diutina rugosa]KAA8898610.1 hypothetical protein DIURU_004630 [Diutina rugosa]